MPLVRALLGLNRFAPSDSKPLVEVVVMSRNSPETGIRVFNNIRSRGLAISRHAFTGGHSVVDYLDAFAVDLFLTTNVEDAQRIIDAQACAAAVLKPPPNEAEAPLEDQVRIAFDGDAVLFDDSSELVYKTEGLGRFHTVEDEKQNEPMQDGPYAILLRKLAKLQALLPFGADTSPVRIAIVTARSAPAEMRVINTLRHWGVYVNEIFFLGGMPKSACPTAPIRRCTCLRIRRWMASTWRTSRRCWSKSSKPDPHRGANPDARNGRPPPCAHPVPPAGFMVHGSCTPGMNRL
jgi:5'-nucleotidase